MSVVSRWRKRLRLRRKLLKNAKRLHKANPTRANAERVRLRKRQVRAAWRVIRRHRSKFVVIDGCPVPRSMADAVNAIRDRSGARLVSCYRGDQATSLLKRLGKSTQRMLWEGWVRRLPGYNPANPPGQSTHELFSDGVAYPGPRGRPLVSTWRCGMDWNYPDAALRAGRELGMDIRRPYSDGREYHHLNFYKRPRVKGRK